MFFFLALSCSEYGYTEKGNINPDSEKEEEAAPTSDPVSLPSDEEDEPEPTDPVNEPSSSPTSEPSEPAFEAPPEDDGFDPEETIIEEEPFGNVVTILMTLSDMWIPPQTADQLIYNAVQFVSPVLDPKVLIIRDDNHNGEDVQDSENIQQWLQNRALTVDFMEEPSEGVTINDLWGYHVVVLSNPGYPPDDIGSIESFREFSMQGYGIIFQGDDMTRLTSPLMESLTRLQNIDNGTSYYGVNIDNNQGQTYEVSFIEGTVLTEGIGNFTFEYGNDIDTAQPIAQGMSVAAECTVQGSTHPMKPVITAFSPEQEFLE